MRTGLVSLIGAGPGAADLITLRGARRLADADIVLWSPGLVSPDCVREHANPAADLVDCSRLSHDEVVEHYRKAAKDRLQVVKLLPADGVLWGAVREHYEACKRIGVAVDIVPGVAGFSAAAAVVGADLANSDMQSVVLTKLDSDISALPDPDRIREFAKHHASMVIHAAGARTARLAEELRAGGYADDTPVTVVYKASWPDELVLSTSLGELESMVKQRKLWRNVVFLVGGSVHTPARARYRKTETVSESEVNQIDEPELSLSRGTRKTTWSARAGRSSRLAARWETRQTTPPENAETIIPIDRAASSTSHAAWRAVRGLQDTARAAAKTSPKSPESVDTPALDEPLAESTSGESLQKTEAAPALRPVVTAASVSTPRTSAPVAKAAPSTSRAQPAKSANPASRAKPGPKKSNNRSNKGKTGN